MYPLRLTMTAVALGVALYAQASSAALNEKPNYTIEMAQPESVVPPAAQASPQAAAPAPEPAAAPVPAQVTPAPAPKPVTVRPTQTSYESARQLRVSSEEVDGQRQIQSVEPYTSRLPADNYAVPINGAYNDPAELARAQGTTAPAPASTVVQSQENYAVVNSTTGTSTQAAAAHPESVAPQATDTANPSLSTPALSDSGERIQEVTVPLETNLDAAILAGFKSLQNSITLGLGQNSTLPLSVISSALRGYGFDENNNITLRFSLAAAERIMYEQGNAAWVGLTNPVLVWLTVHDSVNGGTQHQLISGQNLDLFAQSLLNAAPTYKYRVMFPILDLEDIQKVSAETVLSHQYEVLMDASRRYGADYFISGVMENTNDGVSFTWNLYNSEGASLASSSLTGDFNEVAHLSTGDIARALMNAQMQSKDEINIAAFGSADVDIDTLGQGEGFIRMKIANIHSLKDFATLRDTFISYGFAGDLRLIGYNGGTLVIEVLTNSDATNFEGTISHSGDFTLLAPWTYSLNKVEAPRQPLENAITPRDPTRPNSRRDSYNPHASFERSSGQQSPLNSVELNQPILSN